MVTRSQSFTEEKAFSDAFTFVLINHSAFMAFWSSHSPNEVAIVTSGQQSPFSLDFSIILKNKTRKRERMRERKEKKKIKQPAFFVGI